MSLANVWFRWLRDKLSRKVDDEPARRERHDGFHRKLRRYSWRLRARCGLGRARRRRRHGAEGRCAGPHLLSHSSTSARSHPIGRPRNWCFFGNLPTIVRALRSQWCRRVSRATSCEVRISFHAGSRSLTQRESGASAAVRPRWLSVRLEEALSIYMARPAHDVWFRSLRDELSLRRDYEAPRARHKERFHRIFDANPSEEIRESSDLPLKSGRA
jgi:hypothetical protein